jgi:hypothetical protein
MDVLGESEFHQMQLRKSLWGRLGVVEGVDCVRGCGGVWRREANV